MPSRFVVKRARSGRFNFAIVTDQGEVNGSVMVPIDKDLSRDEAEDAAHHKIRRLLETLASVAKA